MNNINQIERDTILEMHSKFKKSLISEQVDDLKTKLDKFLSDGCVKNGKIVQLQTKNPALQYAIKQESTKTPGKFRYFFADYRVGIFDGSGKFQFSPSKWSCAGVQQATAAAATAATAAANAADTSLVQQEGDWKTMEEVLKFDTKQNITDPQMYDTKVVNGVTLYRNKSGAGIQSALTPRGQQIFNAYKANGGLTEKEVDPETSTTLVKVKIGSKPDFSADFYMYFDPQQTVRDPKIAAAIQTEVEKTIPTDKKDCKKSIEDYYTNYKLKRKLSDSQLTALKYKVQACKNEFYDNWGFLGGGKVDKILDIMSGGVGGPSKMGDNAKWRLEN